MKSPKCKISWLVAGLLTLLTATHAYAQGLQDLQLFAPADVSPYGNGPQPNEGYFFAFDGLFWSIGKPETRPIGMDPSNVRPVFFVNDSNLDFQNSTADTGPLVSGFVEGNRFEFGRVCGQNGWFGNVYWLQRQTQSFESSNVDMVFNDPVIGLFNERRLQGLVNHVTGVPFYPGMPNPPYVPSTQRLYNLPITFRTLQAENEVNHWNVELMYLRRLRPLNRGGVIELFIGARYLQFDEQFHVTAMGGALADSFWSSVADNRVVGPQVGGRWFRKSGRWMLSGEGRFLAGFNSQSIRQQGGIGDLLVPPGGVGTNQPFSLGPTAFTHVAHVDEFTPLVEVRADLRYQVTRAISLRAGWTGIWMDGIARASSVINYEVPAMGIDLSHNRQNVFINGLTLGVDINR